MPRSPLHRRTTSPLDSNGANSSPSLARPSGTSHQRPLSGYLSFSCCPLGTLAPAWAPDNKACSTLGPLLVLTFPTGASFPQISTQSPRRSFRPPRVTSLLLALLCLHSTSQTYSITVSYFLDGLTPQLESKLQGSVSFTAAPLAPTTMNE